MTRITKQQFLPLDALNAPEDSQRFRRPPIFGLDARELAARMVEIGQPAWRGRQIAEAIYQQRITDISAISTLPKSLREKLAKEGWQVSRPSIAQTFQSIDGTERYLVEFPGSGPINQTAEAVWMPEGDDGESGDSTEDANQVEPDQPQSGGAPSISRPFAKWVGNHISQLDTPEERESGTTNDPGCPRSLAPGDRGFHQSEPSPNTDPQRATICISSQIGCAVNCQFCLTAKLGLQRNLTAGEIAGQVVSVLARHNVEIGRDRLNLVFMGMGEPFLNYDNFMAAVRLLVNEVGLSPQRMTVSTSGIVPGIERFALEPDEIRPKLAISLNAPNDAVRAEIMPINRKWNIEDVVDAVRKVKLRPRERITFEYVLLGNITDRPEHAQQVARLVRRTGLPAKVNLIAWNPGPGIPYTMPSPESVDSFRQALIASGIPAFLRKPRGRDIYAACGQLKRTVEG